MERQAGMTTEYLHGVETIEVSDGIRPVRRVRTSVVSVTGTAPDADPDVFPLNRPVIIAGNTRLAAQLGRAGTLYDSVAAVYQQIGAIVSVVRVDQGMTADATLANVVGDLVTKTGIFAHLSAQSLTGIKPKLHTAAGWTSARPTTGIREIQVTEGGEGYTSAPTVVITPAKGTTAIAVVQGGTVQTVIVTAPGLGHTAAPAITFTGGGGSDAAATAIVGTTANPAAVSLASLADRTRGFGFADGPNTSNDAAISYRGDFGSDRLMVIDPHVLAYDTTIAANVARPASAYAAGLQSKMDNERGFWWPFSNQVINGVTGVSRPIEANLSDRNSEHNWLNENEITTIIRDNGFRFFGLRSCSGDPATAFMSVRRIIDVVRDEVEAAFTWALDRPFSQQLVREIIESVNAYLRLLKTEGAIVGGTAWLNPDFNPASNLMDGKLTIDFDIEPVAPIERLTFRIHRNPDYYTGAVEEIVRAIAA